jgi:hypothetical protein
MDLGSALVAKLEGVIDWGSGRRYALCPVHVDRSPSLAIHTTDDGRILVHCFAGCSVESIVRVLGLGREALFPDQRTRDYSIVIARRLGMPAEPDCLEVERWVLRIAAARCQELGRTSVLRTGRASILLDSGW